MGLSAEHIRRMRDSLREHWPASTTEVIIGDERTTEHMGASVYFCLDTELSSLQLRITTTWWKPDCDKPGSWARSVVGSTNPHLILARVRDYPLPVSRVGLTEAHHYLVEEAKAGRYPADGVGPIPW